jgi:nitrite reductase/ring-hydroxylating ferredoxin subunit/uncharacterized membrane protein
MPLTSPARVLDRLVRRLEAGEGLDPPAAGLAKAVSAVVKGPAEDALSGTWLGHPLHPLLVAVPIGCWSSAILLDFSGADPDAARRLIGAGLLAAVPTAASGATDWTFTEGAERRVGFVHAACNWSAIALFGLSWRSRRRHGRSATGTGLALLGSAFLTAGGYLGGHLTYAAGVGVDTTAFSTGPDAWTDVVSEGEVTSASLVAADLPGGSVVLTRYEGRIVAMDNRCTHRGGPLAEGSIVDGCLECPWHASRFDLRDIGAVVKGPATRPQPSYGVQVAAGRIQVRRHDERSLRTNPVGSGGGS